MPLQTIQTRGELLHIFLGHDIIFSIIYLRSLSVLEAMAVRGDLLGAVLYAELVEGVV
jgi:hypothetical protein